MTKLPDRSPTWQGEDALAVSRAAAGKLAGRWQTLPLSASKLRYIKLHQIQRRSFVPRASSFKSASQGGGSATSAVHGKLLVAAGVLLVGPICWGSSAADTGALGVTASILHQCTVGDAALDIGAVGLVHPSGRMELISNGASVAIPWSCTNGTAAALSLGLGANAQGGERRMKSPAATQFLGYQLREGSASGQPIGSTAIALAGADGTNKAFTVWGGPVNSGENLAAKPAGDYRDAVLLTITFSP